MKFLNKKEQVIDLEMTPYGISMFAKGRFKPEYYAFFDDELLYDSRYSGFSEVQNSSSARIVEMPQLEMQTFLYGAETQVHAATAYHRLTSAEKTQAYLAGQVPTDINNSPYVSDDSVTIGTIPDKGTFGIPIGTTSMSTSKAAAWKINVLEGAISSSSPQWNYPNGSHKVLEIPQLNMEPVTYKLKLSDKVLSENYFDGWTLDETSPIKNTILNVIDDSIILEINENNTDFDWENFEIEVFAVNTAEYTNADGSTWSKEFLVPLYFKKQKSLVQGDILLEPDDVVFDGNTFIDSNYVEYYFDILVDKEIDQKKLCSLKPPDKTQGIFSAEVLECDELENEEKINIEELYDTVNENIDEDCE